MAEPPARGAFGAVPRSLIAVVDGLKGFPDVIAAVFPRTQVQAGIVHLMRNSLGLFVRAYAAFGHAPSEPYNDRRAVAAA
jgi:Transposase, Mutator family